MSFDANTSLERFVGCSGWSYNSWQNTFYPSNIDNRLWLPYYSQIFNYVEIDSTFYRIPSEFMVKNWTRRTSPNFRFTAKFPKVITHDKKLKNVEKELTLFYEAMMPLKDKLLALLIQFPPYVKITEGMEALKQYDFFFDDNFRYAVEVRHSSWFSDLAYNFFKNNNICMVWNQLDIIQTPAIVTTDFVYLRLIGDRSIKETDFGKIQKDRENEMKYWANKFREIEDNEKNVNVGIAAANNHYAGFGAATANMFRVMNGLAPVQWGIPKELDYSVANEIKFPGTSRYQKTKQKTLFDYISS
ncbi:MAG TPA: DUF72 domain-containing protein [Nitrososphaeraceae archaeon]|nr:DUF72 domain-containing protein [Nitrososphaeraceae archaeon]